MDVRAIGSATRHIAAAGLVDPGGKKRIEEALT